VKALAVEVEASVSQGHCKPRRSKEHQEMAAAVGGPSLAVEMTTTQEAMAAKGQLSTAVVVLGQVVPVSGAGAALRKRAGKQSLSGRSVT